MILLGGLAVVAVLLSFIDLGVHRLPGPIVAITAATVTAVLTVASASSADPWRRLAAAAIPPPSAGASTCCWRCWSPTPSARRHQMGGRPGAGHRWLGGPVLAVLVAGALIAVTMGALLALRRVQRHEAVAFGPFLSSGALTALALYAL